MSFSWYYKHRKLILSNKTKEQREIKDLKIIKNEFLKYNSKHWYRMLTMDLKAKWIIFNHKKVLRLRLNGKKWVVEKSKFCHIREIKLV